MNLRFWEYDLTLKHPFTISRGSVSTKTVVITEIEHGGITGQGEAAPISRYGESAETVKAFLSRVDLSPFGDPFALEQIMGSLAALGQGNTAARASIDLALHDWIGKKLGVPLYRWWGLDKAQTPVSSFTIGIDEPRMIERKVKEAEEYPILKVKLGTDRDEEIMRSIRRATTKTIRVDANEGWKTREEALKKILWLEDQGVEFVEQPMPAQDVAGTAWVRERVHIPLIADENSIHAHDVPALAGVFDGVNLKLMKSTGLREGLQFIHTARSCGLKVMIGCMIETSLGITAAAHLSPLADFADLDGGVLTSNDPFDGVRMDHGKLLLPERPGIGVIRQRGAA
jgi:L-Ala-D/L-Glu epimerase